MYELRYKGCVRILELVMELELCGIRVIYLNCYRIGYKVLCNWGKEKKFCLNEKCINYFKCGKDCFYNDFW